jgi:hypothetical protein
MDRAARLRELAEIERRRLQELARLRAERQKRAQEAARRQGR